MKQFYKRKSSKAEAHSNKTSIANIKYKINLIQDKVHLLKDEQNDLPNRVTNLELDKSTNL